MFDAIKHLLMLLLYATAVSPEYYNCRLGLALDHIHDCYEYVIVITQDECDILVITRV